MFACDISSILRDISYNLSRHTVILSFSLSIHAILILLLVIDHMEIYNDVRHIVSYAHIKNNKVKYYKCVLELNLHIFTSSLMDTPSPSLCFRSITDLFKLNIRSEYTVKYEHNKQTAKQRQKTLTPKRNME